MIGAESGAFADRAAAAYLDAGSGPDWRGEVALIHDPARVSALLLGAVGRRLDAPAAARLAPLLGATGAATGAAAGTDTRAALLDARLRLARPGERRDAELRLAAAGRRRATDLSLTRAMADSQDAAALALAARLNRDLALADGFIAAGGYDFVATLEDAADDLGYRLDELQAETAAEVDLQYFTAFAAPDQGAARQIAAQTEHPARRQLDHLIAAAEAEVLEQLATETGRAAARRQEGHPL